MCVFPCAPGHKLKVKYVGETIRLCKGRAHVIMDILLENSSNAPLERVYLFYPHPYCRKRKRIWKLEEYPKVVDISYTLNRGVPEDEAYYAIGLGGRWSEDKKEKKLALTLKDEVAGEVLLEGMRVEEGSKLDNDQPMRDASAKDPLLFVLTNLGFSVFVCELTTPIPADDSRWMRWEVQPPQARVQFFSRCIAPFVDKVGHQFEIMGPEDVASAFREGLETLLESIHQCRMPRGITEAQATGKAQWVKDRYITEKLDASDTGVEFEQWRIYLLPDRRSEMKVLSSAGDAAPTSGSWNRITKWVGKKRKQDLVVCWQCKGSFRLLLEYEYAQLIPRLIPWVAIVLALAGLAATFYCGTPRMALPQKPSVNNNRIPLTGPSVNASTPSSAQSHEPVKQQKPGKP